MPASKKGTTKDSINLNIAPLIGFTGKRIEGSTENRQVLRVFVWAKCELPNPIRQWISYMEPSASEIRCLFDISDLIEFLKPGITRVTLRVGYFSADNQGSSKESFVRLAEPGEAWDFVSHDGGDNNAPKSLGFKTMVFPKAKE